jgi:hypothetical protein
VKLTKIVNQGELIAKKGQLVTKDLPFQIIFFFQFEMAFFFQFQIEHFLPFRMGNSFHMIEKTSSAPYKCGRDMIDLVAME